MKIEDVIGLVILGTWLGMLALESLFPAREYPRVRGWRLLGALRLLLYMTVSTVLPLLLPPSVLGWRLLDLTGLGIAPGVVIGFARRRSPGTGTTGPATASAVCGAGFTNCTTAPPAWTWAGRCCFTRWRWRRTP
jgi:hypothetical protein